MRLVLPTLIALLVLTPLFGAEAQTHGSLLELEARAGRVTADGDDFDGTKAATGYGAIARACLFPHLCVGGGVHYSDHGLESLPEHLQIRTVFGEGRLTFPLGRSPFRIGLGARIGKVHEDITIVDWTAQGRMLGGFVSLDRELTRHITATAELSRTSIHLDDRQMADGSTASGTAVDGSSLGVEFGIRFRL